MRCPPCPSKYRISPSPERLDFPPRVAADALAVQSAAHFPPDQRHHERPDRRRHAVEKPDRALAEIGVVRPVVAHVGLIRTLWTIYIPLPG